MGLTKSELELMGLVNNHVDHFEPEYADAPGGGNGQPASLAYQKGNPITTNGAQYSVSNITYAFTATSGGVFTQINFSALPAGAKSAFFFYGVNDFNSGYSDAKALVPLAVGSYGTPFIYGSTPYPVVNVNGVLLAIDATVSALLQNGDVVVPITVTSGGTNYVILSVHRCQQVTYSTLLKAGISNSFLHKGIRYFLQDETTAVLNQYTQPLFNFAKSWLGKFEKDSTDINSNNQPFNFRKNIVDVPLQMGVTKGDGLASSVLLAGIAGNTLTISLSTFVSNAINPQK